MEDIDSGLNKKFDFDFDVPVTSEVSVGELKKFLRKDKKAVLIFYGGEPLLEIEKIKKIIDQIDVPFRMQTNGKLLDKLPSFYVNKIGKILISIDGARERTDSNRGEGIYDKVMENIKLIKKKGYKGELVARMTISEFPDIYEQVLDLLNNRFSSVHWQLDAGFYKFDFDFKKFSKFAEKYNKSITKLIDYWFEQMKCGKVIRLYPFIAIVDSLLKNEKTLLRCGVGHSGYAITTNGKIVFCPIMNGIKNFEIGNLDTNPKKLKKIDVSGRCLKCGYKDLCGGRCLYWNASNLWGEGDKLICNTIKHLIDELKSKIPKIKGLIDKKVINLKDFEYEKYFGPEIIP
jgi:uncharacterized protein